MNTIKTLFFLTLGLGQLSAFAQWETVHYPNHSAPTLPQLHAGEFTNNMNGVAAGKDNNGAIIMKTKDGGNTWTTVYHKKYEPAASFYDVFFTNDSTAFAVGFNSLNDTSFIATTKDFGLTWKVKHIYARRLNRVYFSSSLIGYVVGDHGKIFKTNDGGKSWKDISLAKKHGLISVHFTSDTVGYVTASDTIFKTVDGGNTWTSSALGETEGTGCTVYFSSEKIGYCEYQTYRDVGIDETIIYKTLDGGATWKKHSSFNSFNFNSRMVFLNDKVGYIVGFFKVWKTVDGGLTWKGETSSKPSQGNFFDNLTDISFPDNKVGFIIGYDQLYRVSDPLSTWPIETNSSALVQVFPNPAKSKIHLQSSMPVKLIQMYNLQGQLLKQAVNVQIIEVGDLPRGPYVLRVNNGEGISQRKVLLY